MAHSLLRAAFHEATKIEDAGGLAEIADTAAHLATATGDTQVAANLLAWSNQQRDELHLSRDPHDEKLATELLAKLPTPSPVAGDAPEPTNPLGEFLD